MGLVSEDTREESELVEAAVEEMTGHVNGAMEAVRDDNELFVTKLTEAFHKSRASILKARATYLKIPVPSGGGLDDSLSSAVDFRAGDASDAGKPKASVKEITRGFEEVRRRRSPVSGTFLLTPPSLLAPRFVRLRGRR